MLVLKANKINTLDKTERLLSMFCLQFESELTVKAYKKDLKDFFAYCENNSKNISKLRPHDIFEYLKGLNKAPATTNRKISALKSFFRWAESNELNIKNPTKSISIRRTACLNPTLAFSDEETKKMIESPDSNYTKGKVHRLILVMLFYMGLRRSELVNIKKEDILQDRDHLILKIMGKGGKVRNIPISTVVHQEIQKYLSSRSDIQGSDYLIQINKIKSNKPVGESTVLRVVKKYAKIANIDKRVSPHSCRATAISHLLEKSVSIRNVADFAGHTSTVTTQLYDKKRDGYTNSAAYRLDY